LLIKLNKKFFKNWKLKNIKKKQRLNIYYDK